MLLRCVLCRLPDTTAHQNVSCNENSRSSEPRKHLGNLKPCRRDGRQRRVSRTEEEEEDSPSVGVHAPPITGSFPSADLNPPLRAPVENKGDRW